MPVWPTKLLTDDLSRSDEAMSTAVPPFLSARKENWRGRDRQSDRDGVGVEDLPGFAEVVDKRLGTQLVKVLVGADDPDCPRPRRRGARRGVEWDEAPRVDPAYLARAPLLLDSRVKRVKLANKHMGRY